MSGEALYTKEAWWDFVIGRIRTRSDDGVVVLPEAGRRLGVIDRG